MTASAVVFLIIAVFSVYSVAKKIAEGSEMITRRSQEVKPKTIEGKTHNTIVTVQKVHKPYDRQGLEIFSPSIRIIWYVLFGPPSRRGCVELTK